MKLKINKLLTLCTAFCLLLTGAITGLAEEQPTEPTGSIVLNTGSIDVTDTNFDAYKVFDVTTDGTNVSYVINSKFQTFFNEQLLVDAADNDAAYNLVKGSASNLDFQKNLKDYINKSNVTKKEFTKVEGQNKFELSNVEYGYYVVVPNKANGETQLTLIFTTLYKNNQDVYLKGVQPTVEKTADGTEWTSAQVGDTVNFKVVSMVPDMTGFTEYYFKLVDTFDEALTMNVDTLNLKVWIAGEPLTNQVDFSAEIVDQQLTVTINNFTKYAEQANEEIVFEYQAVLNEKAVDKSGVTNTANVHWGNKENELTGGKPDTSRVYTHTLTITKNDDKNQGLPGALFELYRDTEEEKNKVQFVDLKNGNYRVAIDGDTAKVSTVVSPDGGIITIKGLDEGAYKLVETKAPDGYNKLPNAIDININAKIREDNITVDVEGNAHTVVNNPGTLLPETGGMGTVMFTVVGVVGILAVAYSFRPKKNK